MTRNLGILGFGNVGKYVYAQVKEHATAQVTFVFDLFIDRVRPMPLESVAQMDEAALREVFLVVETAEPHAVKTYGPDIVKRAHLLISSLSALADESLFEELSTIARRSGTHLFVPHGAVLGLDGIRDGRHLIESIMVTTVKNPRTWRWKAWRRSPARLSFSTVPPGKHVKDSPAMSMYTHLSPLPALVSTRQSQKLLLIRV